MKPRSDSTSAPASSGRSNSARTITAVSATGPPTNTGSVSPASHERSGTASPTVDPAGRLSTSPIAPSSVCSAIRTTVRTKFGSRRTGEARMSLPRSDSAMPSIVLYRRFALARSICSGGLAEVSVRGDAPARGERDERVVQRPAIGLRLPREVRGAALERHRARVVADRAQGGDLLGAQRRRDADGGQFGALVLDGLRGAGLL